MTARRVALAASICAATTTTSPAYAQYVGGQKERAVGYACGSLPPIYIDGVLPVGLYFDYGRGCLSPAYSWDSSWSHGGVSLTYLYSSGDRPSSNSEEGDVPEPADGFQIGGGAEAGVVYHVWPRAAVLTGGEISDKEGLGETRECAVPEVRGSRRKGEVRGTTVECWS